MDEKAVAREDGFWLSYSSIFPNGRQPLFCIKRGPSLHSPRIIRNRLSEEKFCRMTNLAQIMGSDYQSYHENELLQLVAGGDDRAFRVLYDRYWKRLFVIAFMRLHSR